MCEGLRGHLPALLLLLLVLVLVVLVLPGPAAAGAEATHPPEGPPDRTPPQKGRLSLQNTGTEGKGEGGGGKAKLGALLAACSRLCPVHVAPGLSTEKVFLVFFWRGV